MMEAVLLILLVALCGAAGAAARFLISRAVDERAHGVFPWGTWVVNVIGSFGLGVLMGSAARFDPSPFVVAMIGVGFLGAFTTFSTWMYEAIRLIEAGAWRSAAWNLVGSVVVGFLVATVGLLIAG